MPDLRVPPRLDDVPELRRDRLGLLMRAARELGDVAHLRFGARDFYLFVHPDAIQHILVANHRNYRKGPDHIYLKPVIGEGVITSDGTFHLRQRRMLQPAFHRARVSAYASAMTAYAGEMLDQWSDGATFDVTHEMLCLTLRIVIQMLCGVDVEDAADTDGQGLKAALAHFSSEPRTLLPNTRRAVRELDDVLYDLIARRRAAGHDTGDVLSMLLMAGEDGRGEVAMSDRQVRDELMTLFFAGHDTTASALSWSWYLVAQNPQVEAKLHAELDAALGGRVPGADDMPRLRYVTMIFAEAMRLFPPVWSISRLAIADDQVCGYHVPAGMPVMVSPYVTHHDARFFADPERFDPERFHPDHDVRKTIPRLAYFPFGGGPRQCMGEPFAWMEGTLLLATIAQRYRIRPLPGHPIVPNSMITLRPKHGIQVVAEAR